MDARTKGAIGMTHWITWNGGECPVDPETPVMVRYRADADDFDFASYRRFRAGAVVWQHYDTAPETDVVAYTEKVSA
jgi:hypothetical protein